MPSPSTFGSSDPRASGTTPTLDSPPPSFPARPARPPGADTVSLLGDRADSDVSGGEGMQSPVAKIVAAIAMYMQATNIIQSIMPGAISPQFELELQQMASTLPEAAKQISQMQSPLGMLSAAAALAPNGGMMNGGGGGSGAPGASSNLSINPSLGASAGMPANGVPQRM